VRSDDEAGAEHPEDMRAVHADNDQTRVVDRHPLGETRVVENDVDAGGRHVGSDDDDGEATRLTKRRADAVDDADPDRTQLSTRSLSRRSRRTARLAALPDSTGPGGVPGENIGVARLPDAPVGAKAVYGVRAPTPESAQIPRADRSPATPPAIPPVTLPATAEQIRRAGGIRDRRRSVKALSIIVLTTLLVAAAATVAIIVISGL